MFFLFNLVLGYLLSYLLCCFKEPTLGRVGFWLLSFESALLKGTCALLRTSDGNSEISGVDSDPTLIISKPTPKGRFAQHHPESESSEVFRSVPESESSGATRNRRRLESKSSGIEVLRNRSPPESTWS